MDVEIKSFCRMGKKEEGFSATAKAAMALANSGGGYIICGFRKNDSGLGYSEQTISTQDLDTWEQTRLSDALAHFMNPVPNVMLLKLPGDHQRFPAVYVPSIWSTPVVCIRHVPDVCDKGRIYIRKPGPKTEEPFTPDEWRPVITKCLASTGDELLSAIRNIIAGVPIHAVVAGADDLQDFLTLADNLYEELRQKSLDKLPAPSLGRWAFTVAPVPPLSTELSVRNLRQVLDNSVVREAALPIGDTAYPDESGLTTLNRDGAKLYRAFYPARIGLYVDFWAADTLGRFHASRSYFEDADTAVMHRQNRLPEWGTEPRVFLASLHTRDLAEFVIHALRYSRELAVLGRTVDRLQFSLRFDDLEDRRILTHQRAFGYSVLHNQSMSHTWTGTAEISADLPEVNVPDVLPQLVGELWDSVFNLYRPPPGFYQLAYEKAID